jgi:glycogen debranching enzyme
MEEIIQIEDRYYILASPHADERDRVLKHGDTFAVFDQFGDIRHVGLGDEGIYHEDTRYLSRLRLWINGRRPLLLSSTVHDDNALLTVDLTNQDIQQDGHVSLPRDTLHIFRSAFLWENACYMRLRVRNYAHETVRVSLSLVFDADFADIFEVRGMHREETGRLLEPRIDESTVELQYDGLDGVVRRTRLQFSPQPDELSATTARCEAEIPAHGEQTFYVTIHCNPPDEQSSFNFVETFKLALNELKAVKADDAIIETSNEQFNEWLNRSAADLHMMVTHTEHGAYPYAGVPWFSTPFGRDGIITAFEYLWVNPALARGVLGYLAATQADEEITEQDAEPGKILHETRRGEMAAMGEIPFGKYYGTVDATPLFVVLAGDYYQRTGDRAFIESIWPNIQRALEWIERYGDSDGDGFIEYARRATKGLVTQGWKDSWDSTFHEDGALAEGPTALCEVQAYVFAAWNAAATLAEMLGHPQHAQGLRAKAVKLQKQFESAFWCDDLGTYAIALDGQKRPCRVRTSNAGHCLFAGIASPEHAQRVAETLLDRRSFSGWGIRTVAESEARYNPMAYHNGSIWPHDNALIASGFARYGLKQPVVQLFNGQFDVSASVDLHRMPELFCGFPRRPGSGPTRYPVACAPQSWAAGAVFMLLQASLGLCIDAPRRQIRFHRPLLPPFLESVTITNLRVGDASVDLSLNRYTNDVGFNLIRREGDVQVVTIK